MYDFYWKTHFVGVSLGNLHTEIQIIEMESGKCLFIKRHFFPYTTTNMQKPSNTMTSGKSFFVGLK